MVYLADWKAAIEKGQPLTNIEWVFMPYGPYVEDVVNAAKAEPETFALVSTFNAHGSAKDLVKIKKTPETPTIDEGSRETLDFVIRQTSPLNFEDFIRLVYSTYPIRTQPRYSTLDLVRLAHAYKDRERGFQTASQMR